MAAFPNILIALTILSTVMTAGGYALFGFVNPVYQRNKASSITFGSQHLARCRPFVPALRMAVSGGGERRGPGGTRKEPKGEEPVVEGIGKVQAIRQRKGEATGIRGSVKTQGKKWDNITPVPPSIRVSSGTAKGRKLSSPDVYLRPMMGKVSISPRSLPMPEPIQPLLQVKEALFSILREYDVLRDDAVALDTFAGCGSVGIEALSQVVIPHSPDIGPAGGSFRAAALSPARDSTAQSRGSMCSTGRSVFSLIAGGTQGGAASLTLQHSPASPSLASPDPLSTPRMEGGV
jgi:hypothetical protein